jgi:hypothetical protein
MKQVSWIALPSFGTTPMDIWIVRIQTARLCPLSSGFTLSTR